jgi:hypothetical protein
METNVTANIGPEDLRGSPLFPFWDPIYSRAAYFTSLNPQSRTSPIVLSKLTTSPQVSISFTRRVAFTRPRLQKHRLDHTIIPIELDPVASVAQISESNF